MKKKITGLIMALLITGGLTACGTAAGEVKAEAAVTDTRTEAETETAASETAATDTDEGNERISFNYIINNIGSVHTIDIALEEGFFDEAGIDVNTVGIADGGVACIEAIVTGNADFAIGGIPAYINAILGQAPIKVFYGGPAIAHEKDPGYQMLVRKDSGINGPEDLKGKTIAVAALGAWYEYFTRLYLEKGGLTVDDVNLTVVPGGQHLEVLLSGQADATVDWTPIADAALENDEIKAVTNLYEVMGEDKVNNGWGTITNTKILESRPEDVKRLTAVLVKTDEWIEANPEAAIADAKKIFEDRGQSEIYSEYWKPFHLANHGLWSDETVQFFIDYMGSIGQIDPEQIKPSDIYTNEFNPYYEK